MATEVGEQINSPAVDIKVVVPGEIITNEIINKTNLQGKIILGPGIQRQVEDNFIINKSGLLKYRSPNVYYVEHLQKQYIPNTNEPVVGIITKKVGEFFKVDVLGPDRALLHQLAFEGATKKNKPEINVGDAVFGRLVVSSPDMEPELVCMSVKGKKELFRMLPNDGFLFRVSVHLVRKLLLPKYPLLSVLGDLYTYESAIGMNGIIWIRTTNVIHMMNIANAILGAETVRTCDIDSYCERLKNDV